MSTLDDQERRRRCFWCGRPGAATKDHVFPRGLFPEPMPEGVTPITVPACRQHNGAFNLDEEYFRDFVVGAAYEHPEARQIWDVRTVSALEKKPKYRALLASQLQDFEVLSDTGLYLGTGSMMHADPRRIELVLKKIVTGLVFRESGNVLGFPAFYFQQILTRRPGALEVSAPLVGGSATRAHRLQVRPGRRRAPRCGRPVHVLRPRSFRGLHVPTRSRRSRSAPGAQGKGTVEEVVDPEPLASIGLDLAEQPHYTPPSIRPHRQQSMMSAQSSPRSSR